MSLTCEHLTLKPLLKFLFKNGSCWVSCIRSKLKVICSNAATSSREGLAGRGIGRIFAATGSESVLFEEGAPASESVREMTDAVSSDDSPVVVISNRSSSIVALLCCLLLLFFPICVTTLLLVPDLQNKVDVSSCSGLQHSEQITGQIDTNVRVFEATPSRETISTSEPDPLSSSPSR